MHSEAIALSTPRRRNGGEVAPQPSARSQRPPTPSVDAFHAPVTNSTTTATPATALDTTHLDELIALARELRGLLCPTTEKVIRLGPTLSGLMDDLKVLREAYERHRLGCTPRLAVTGHEDSGKVSVLRFLVQCTGEGARGQLPFRQSPGCSGDHVPPGASTVIDDALQGSASLPVSGVMRAVPPASGGSDSTSPTSLTLRMDHLAETVRPTPPLASPPPMRPLPHSYTPRTTSTEATRASSPGLAGAACIGNGEGRRSSGGASPYTFHSTPSPPPLHFMPRLPSEATASPSPPPPPPSTGVLSSSASAHGSAAETDGRAGSTISGGCDCPTTTPTSSFNASPLPTPPTQLGAAGVHTQHGHAAPQPNGKGPTGTGTSSTPSPPPPPTSSPPEGGLRGRRPPPRPSPLSVEGITGMKGSTTDSSSTVSRGGTSGRGQPGGPGTLNHAKHTATTTGSGGGGGGDHREARVHLPVIQVHSPKEPVRPSAAVTEPPCEGAAGSSDMACVSSSTENHSPLSSPSCFDAHADGAADGATQPPPYRPTPPAGAAGTSGCSPSGLLSKTNYSAETATSLPSPALIDSITRTSRLSSPRQVTASTPEWYDAVAGEDVMSPSCSYRLRRRSVTVDPGAFDVTVLDQLRALEAGVSGGSSSTPFFSPPIEAYVPMMNSFSRRSILSASGWGSSTKLRSFDSLSRASPELPSKTPLPHLLQTYPPQPPQPPLLATPHPPKDSTTGDGEGVPKLAATAPSSWVIQEVDDHVLRREPAVNPIIPVTCLGDAFCLCIPCEEVGRTTLAASLEFVFGAFTPASSAAAAAVAASGGVVSCSAARAGRQRANTAPGIGDKVPPTLLYSPSIGSSLPVSATRRTRIASIVPSAEFSEGGDSGTTDRGIGGSIIAPVPITSGTMPLHDEFDDDEEEEDRVMIATSSTVRSRKRQSNRAASSVVPASQTALAAVVPASQFPTREDAATLLRLAELRSAMASQTFFVLTGIDVIGAGTERSPSAASTPGSASPPPIAHSLEDLVTRFCDQVKTLYGVQLRRWQVVPFSGTISLVTRDVLKSFCDTYRQYLREWSGGGGGGGGSVSSGRKLSLAASPVTAPAEDGAGSGRERRFSRNGLTSSSVTTVLVRAPPGVNPTGSREEPASVVAGIGARNDPGTAVAWTPRRPASTSPSSPAVGATENGAGNGSSPQRLVPAPPPRDLPPLTVGAVVSSPPVVEAVDRFCSEVFGQRFHEGRQGRLEPEDLAEVVLQRASTVTWFTSGAQQLSLVAQQFERNSNSYILSQAALSLMSWATQLLPALSVASADAMKQSQRLRERIEERRRGHRLIDQSIAQHKRSSPLSNAVDLEVKMQEAFSALVQSFLRDLRVIVALQEEPREIDVFGSRTLTTAFRRLQQCVLRFRSFYIDGKVTSRLNVLHRRTTARCQEHQRLLQQSTALSTATDASKTDGAVSSASADGMASATSSSHPASRHDLIPRAPALTAGSKGGSFLSPGSAAGQSNSATKTSRRSSANVPHQSPTTSVPPSPAGNNDGANRQAQEADPAFEVDVKQLTRERRGLERQLAVHLSQLNTEIINFFVAVCSATLPKLGQTLRQTVQEVSTMYEEIYQNLLDVNPPKDRVRLQELARSARALPSLQLLTLAPTRELERFVVGLRAALCEDQVRALARLRKAVEQEEDELNHGHSFSFSAAGASVAPESASVRFMSHVRDDHTHHAADNVTPLSTGESLEAAQQSPNAPGDEVALPSHGGASTPRASGAAMDEVADTILAFGTFSHRQPSTAADYFLLPRPKERGPRPSMSVVSEFAEHSGPPETPPPPPPPPREDGTTLARTAGGSCTISHSAHRQTSAPARLKAAVPQAMVGSTTSKRPLGGNSAHPLGDDAKEQGSISSLTAVAAFGVDEDSGEEDWSGPPRQHRPSTAAVVPQSPPSIGPSFALVGQHLSSPSSQSLVGMSLSALTTVNTALTYELGARTAQFVHRWYYKRLCATGMVDGHKPDDEALVGSVSRGDTVCISPRAADFVSSARSDTSLSVAMDGLLDTQLHPLIPSHPRYHPSRHHRGGGDAATDDLGSPFLASEDALITPFLPGSIAAGRRSPSVAVAGGGGLSGASTNSSGSHPSSAVRRLQRKKTARYVEDLPPSGDDMELSPSTASVTFGTAADTVKPTEETRNWQQQLHLWRADTPAEVKPVYFLEHPALWVLLDVWDEALLGMPYQSWFSLNHQRYAKALNATGSRFMSMQYKWLQRLADTIDRDDVDAETMEQEARRLQPPPHRRHTPPGVGDGADEKGYVFEAVERVFERARVVAQQLDKERAEVLATHLASGQRSAWS